MQKEDLKQIADLLDKKFDEKLEQQNKQIFSRIDEMEERIMTLTKQEFDTVYERLNTIEEKFDTIDESFEAVTQQFDRVEQQISALPTTSQIFNWGDQQIVPMGRMLDKLKFLHIDELKNLPSNLEISQRLVDEDLA
ncbi:MAG: hypothetical protein WCK11_04685 [Candidatus Falkowbacteria bacterium]